MSILGKRRKRVNLYLHDDPTTSFQTVILGISTYIPDCSLLRAEQIATLVHHKGRVQIYSGFSPEVYAIQANLIRDGLIVEAQIKPRKN